jgi:hypothetical protein
VAAGNVIIDFKSANLLDVILTGAPSAGSFCLALSALGVPPQAGFSGVPTVTFSQQSLSDPAGSQQAPLMVSITQRTSDGLVQICAGGHNMQLQQVLV